MEQIVLYLAVLAALSGFGMGLMNLFGPYLKRRRITLPSISIASLLSRFARQPGDDDDLDYEDEDDFETAREFAESSFAAQSNSLLADRRVAIDEEELDDELVEVLNQVAEEELSPAETEDGIDEETDGVEAEAGEEGFGDDDDEEEEYDDEEDEEPTQPEVKVVAAGGLGDDMMSLFNESADDVGKVHAAWREDLPEVSIDELLAEARSISQQFKGKKRDAA